MITLNRVDLDFLLRQVTINYLMPDGSGGFVPTSVFNYSALANALDPSGLREVSGANNNLVGGYWDPTANGGQGAWIPGPNTSWGQANQPFLNQSVGQSVGSAADPAYNTVNPVTGTPSAVTDSDPRLISNLVASMFTDPANPLYNPAAELAATNGGTGSVFEGLQVNGSDTAFVANAGVLGGGRYNGWFVAFGQFFDHGLDFVNRETDPAATITVTLSPYDPLYDPDGADNDPATTFDNVTSIRVRRADVANAGDAGGDGIFGTADDAYHAAGLDGVLNTPDDIYSKPQFINQTGLLIDQSQTYGSHQSVNALIREYDASGRPTGRVVAGNTAVLDNADPSDDGLTQGLATWADIKINALRIGVILNDTTDLHNAPVLRVDPAGKLMFTPNPGETYTTDQIVGFNPATQDPNDPFMRDALGNVLRTGQNMLIDFNPGQPLDAHIITGDGRGNENIGLTSVHHVFHEEHNGLVVNIKTTLLKEALLANDLTVLNGAVGDPSGGWAMAPIASFGSITGVSGLAGNATAIDAFFADPLAVDSALASIDWNGERLYQAARLITESEYNHIAIDQYVGTLYGALPEFVSYSSDINMGVSLEFSQAVFRLGHSMLTETFNVIDPETGQNIRLLDMFLDPTKYTAMLDADGNPADLVNGLLTTLGNEVDEFVTPALQQSLLGQPLDLATINITRGRDVGLPTWNEFRKQVYDQLIQNTNNTNGSALAPYTNWADVFDHLKNPLTGVNLIAAYAQGDDFALALHPLTDAILQARSDYANGLVTLDVLRAAAQALYDAYLDAADPNHAEAAEFMRGTPSYSNGQWTFTGADQGFWDIDLWIGGLAERPLFDGPLGTTFSYVILDFAQRQQDGDRFYYLYRTPMGTHLGNEIIQNQFGNLVSDHTGLDHLNGEIFIWANAQFELTSGNDYFNAAEQTILDVDGTPMAASGGHIVIAGNDGDDYIAAGLGDDTIYGDAGNDQIYGSQGNDHLFGGDGDDYISDDENDDFIAGGAGNDRIFAGPGALDTVFGDEGDDEIHGGDGIDELIGGAGDDMIYGDGDTDVLFGMEGNDYLEGGDSVDEMWGEVGNDWMRGGVGDDHLNGGDGNDLLEGGVGAAANDGDRLFGQGGVEFGIAVVPDNGLMDVVSYEDVNVAITADLETSNQNGTGGLIDTYAQVEGLVGSRFNDNLTGAGPGNVTGNGIDNMLVGGGGDDTLTGLGGDDVIFGDSVVVMNDLSVWDGATPYTTITNWKGTGDDRPDFGALLGLGHFLGETGAAGALDKAVFSGNWIDYDITLNADGSFQIIDTRGIDSTAVGDKVKDVELFQFADGTRTAAQLINQAPTDIQWNGVTPAQSALPAAGAVIANLGTVDPDNTIPFTYTLLSSTSPTGGFSISSTGVVTRTGVAMAANTTYMLTIRTTDAGGKFFDETFTIRTNGDGNGNLSAFATAGDDIMYGDDGNDTLTGGAGNDTLLGQDENDTLDGGLGNDTLNGGVGDSDTASYATALAGVTVSLAIDGQQNTLGAGNDTLVSIENLTGSALGDTLTGDGNANVLAGAAGSDTLNGGGGDDTAVFAGALANHTFSLLSPGIVVATDTVGTGGADTLSSIENVQFNGQSLALRVGTDVGTTMTFNGGADLMLGFGGNDTLNSGGGNDVLIGGAGNDTLNAGGGTDRAVFSGPYTDYGFALSGTSLVVTDSVAGRDGSDTLSSLNNEFVQFGTSVYGLVYGTSGNDNLSANGGADLLLGFGGNDELDGGIGADIMFGGAGNDDFNFDDGDTGVGAAARDIIMDFSGGGGDEDIDLSAIDANTTVGGGGGGGQAFSFIGTAAFTAAGQLRYEAVDTDGDLVNDSTLVQGNVNAALAADFEILLKNYTGILGSGDFIL
jgi:Ca2+-binding RTX toxin-like protein